MPPSPAGAEQVAPAGAASDDDFFRNLPAITEFARAAELGSYADAPRSWLVVISDVAGSTRAIEAGRYKDVNALGVASIVAVQNALSDLEIPYVFGGDGATLLVPGARRARVEAALRGVRRLASEAFGLELRAAIVPVTALDAAGERVAVGKLRASPAVSLALFGGGGFARAERWVKERESGAHYAISREGDETADLEGFECRWQPVSTRRGTIVSLLVLALAASDAERQATYQRTISELERVLETGDARPISLSGLRLSGLFGDFSVEARVRSGQPRGPRYSAALRRARKHSLVGRGLLALGASVSGFDGKTYRQELLENTDFRKFDETLRMVLDLAPAELEALLAHLERERTAGRLVYGVHRSRSALITCFVRAYRGNHLHFVDGGDGGYALAAKELKAQLARLPAERGLQHG